MQDILTRNNPDADIEKLTVKVSCDSRSLPPFAVETKKSVGRFKIASEAGKVRPYSCPSIVYMDLFHINKHFQLP